MADQKVISGFNETLLDQIADVASGQEITSGEASDIIDALIDAPRKAKPSAGFAPLVSGFGERKAAAEEARAESDRLEAAAAEALAAAGGKAGTEGNCINCGHGAHEAGICHKSTFHSLGWDDGYNVVCECAEFVAVTAAQDAARIAHRDAQYALQITYKAEDAAREIERGDHVIVFKGRKIAKGSKGQVAKVSEGTYGWSAFLILEDGSKAWTALTNLKHEEA
jgi:hypothetical protein